MTQPRPILPRLAYLTSPGPGVILLNLQFSDGELPLRLELTQRQLAAILVDGTAMALRQEVGA
jgi:hypothetical protein